MTVTGTLAGPARLSAAAGALIAFALSSPAGVLAAPLAADLGPVVALGEPAGGFVGRLNVTPEHGPVGTPVTVRGQGLPAGQRQKRGRHGRDRGEQARG